MQISAQEWEGEKEEGKRKRRREREETTVEEPMSDIIFLVVAFPLTTKNAYANLREKERERRRGSQVVGEGKHI